MDPDRLRIRPMTTADVPAVVELADREIGRGYYAAGDVRAFLARSTNERGVFAYVAEDGARLVAFRFTLPPGAWDSGRGRGLSPERWPAPIEAAAYFQSCFVRRDYSGHGIGRRLAVRALDALRGAGARIAVAHSWKESPHGSSFRYLSRLGFVQVAEYPRYWYEVDYVCQLDGKPCCCTAIEMVLDLAAPPPAAPPPADNAAGGDASST